MATSRTKSNGQYMSTCQKPQPFRFSSSPPPSSSAFASSTASSFSTRSSSSFFARATSPTRVRMYGHYHQAQYHNQQSQNQSSPSVRFSIDRPISPNRSISMTRQSSSANAVSNRRRTCACSPTTHPGSFRCALHKALRNGHSQHGSQTASYHSSSRLNFRRSAMTNSLVRIGGVEGELVKRALSALIRPSSHHLRRRGHFEPKPSRLSRMAKAEDL